MINTLMYAKKLEDVGVPREQAETHVQLMTEVIQNDIATKNDVLQLRHELQQIEHRLTIRLGSMMAISMTIVISVLTLILKS